MNYLHLPINPEEANENLDRTGLSDIGTFTLDRINAIPDIDTSEINASSIPDPLARILIFKNAFEYFNKLHQKGGGNFDIYEDKHKNHFTLVSDCLDLLELINHHNYRNSITYRDWNIAERINVLNTSTNEAHKHLGNTLKLFFDRNGFPSDFVISLIYFRDNQNNDILIGGTSPFTIVYTAPDWKQKLDSSIQNGLSNLHTNEHDALFDDDLKDIRERPDSFQNFIFKFSNNNENN